MGDFVSQNIPGKFVGRIAQNEEASGRLNSACPWFQFAKDLKLLPFLGPLENINMGLRIAGGLIALELFGHDTVVKFRFHRDRRGHVTVDEVVNKMVGFAVLPLFRMNRESFFAERIRVLLAQLRQFHFGQCIQAGGWDWRFLC
jgi:hypothetical protein